MNWKARALTSPDLDDAHLKSLITRGKPASPGEVASLIGMVLRARGDTAEGVVVTPAPTPVKQAKEKLDKKKAMAKDADASGMVSSEDNATPWEDVLEQAKADDRLDMAIKDGVVFPVKKG